MLNEENIQKQYPLHYLVWINDHERLEKYLKVHSKDVDIEQKDPRQRTPLMLATALDHKDCIRVLLNHNAMVNVTDHSGFNVLHEAVTTADPRLIRDVLQKKKHQRQAIRLSSYKNLLSKICDTPDFYIEMKWEFTSWVPLISQLCPSDTYKIYKKGSKVRVDSTLVGLDDATNWKRGNESLIFIGSASGASFMKIDHNEKRVHKHSLDLMNLGENDDMFEMGDESNEITDDQICDRLTMPIKTTFVDTEKVDFERAKSGIIGFRTDRVETFNGYECKVYWAQNVEFVTKTRIEHLTQEDKNRYKKMKESAAMAPFRTFVGIHEQNIPNPFQNEILEEQWRRNPYKLSLVEYFNLSMDDPRDIGAPREMNIKKQYFKANVWMCDDYPLSLVEQIFPIVDMIATYSSHFAKLRDFITCRLPSGFPVKIEIPLFHLLNARITFENVFAHQKPVDGVHLVDANSENSVPANTSNNLRNCKCIIEDRCFEPPEGYEIIGNETMLMSPEHVDEEDEDYLRFLLNQYSRTSSSTTPNDGSLKNKPETKKQPSPLDTEQLSIMEALSYDSEKDLQRAIQLSLMEYNQQQQILAAAQQRPTVPVHQPHSNGTVVRSSKTSSRLVAKSLVVQQDQHEDATGEEENDDDADNDTSSSTASYTSCDNDNNHPSMDHCARTVGSIVNDSEIDGSKNTELANEDEIEMLKNNRQNLTNNPDRRLFESKTTSNDSRKDDDDRIIRQTIEQSKRDHDEHVRRQKEEEEMLEKVLKLSMVDK